MGEMKNLQPGDAGYDFLQRIADHNALLTRKEQKLRSLMPRWRKVLAAAGFKRQAHRWFYAKRYLLWYIDDEMRLHDRPVA